MTVDEIRSMYSMTDIVNMYGFKVVRGMICCPFHNDKTPSMKIFPKRYHCFTCQAHGDILDFIQKYEKVPFKEAFQRLGGTYKASKEFLLSVQKEKERKAQILQKATRQRELMRSEEKGADYLKKLLKETDINSEKYKKIMLELVCVFWKIVMRTGWLEDDNESLKNIEEGFKAWLAWID